MVGGLRIDEPAADMAICMALISSMQDIPVDDSLIAVGEIGLSGECRAVSDTDKRVSEAKRMGFTSFVIPRLCKNKIHRQGTDGIIPVGGIYDLPKLFAAKMRKKTSDNA